MMSPNSLFDGGEGLCGLNENHQTAKDLSLKTETVFGLWQLVFGKNLQIYSLEPAKPKTKDL
jgi:hypothetical protein